jgi:ketosteroid isomerase-like protein
VKAPIFKTIILLLAHGFLLTAALATQVQQEAKPRKHAMPMPGMGMGHQMHTPASDLRIALVSSWNSADVNRLTSFYGESAVIILPDGSLVTGRQSIREFLERELTNRTHLSLTSIGFELSPELQVDFGVFTKSNTKREDAKQSGTHESQHDSQVEGKYLIVVKRTGSDWKIQEMTFSAARKTFD